MAGFGADSASRIIVKCQSLEIRRHLHVLAALWTHVHILVQPVLRQPTCIYVSQMASSRVVAASLLLASRESKSTTIHRQIQQMLGPPCNRQCAKTKRQANDANSRASLAMRLRASMSVALSSLALSQVTSVPLFDPPFRDSFESRISFVQALTQISLAAHRCRR